MPGLMSRQNRANANLIAPGGYVSKTTTYSMALSDLVVRASTAAGAWTLTLPSVAEAAGLSYFIILDTSTAAGAVSNALTINPLGIRLYRPGQFVNLTSDGIRWHVTGHQLGRTNLPTKGFFERWELPPVMAGFTKGGIPSGVTGDNNVMVCASGNVFIHNVKVTQTLLGPIWLNPGIDISQDLTDNDGIEYASAIVAGSGNPTVFTVGTDAAFFCRALINIADVSGTDDLAVGFRKLEAMQAAIDNYDEMAVIGLSNATGDIAIETILNNAATTTTDTTDNWADAATHSLEVYVSSAGVVTYKIDGAAPSATAAFTFDAGEVVVPFIHLLHATTTPGSVKLYEWECNYQ